jgi:cytidylate kinase
MVGLAVLKEGHDPDDRAAAIAAAQSLDPSAFADGDLRTEAVAAAASTVAVIPEVRAALLDFQRSFAKRQPGAVLDGRDIGTVVCPDADVKLFITASAEVRAKRRQLELGADSYDAVLAEIRTRDERDSKRAAAPLVPASDATVIDTSGLTVDEAIAAAIKACQ